MFNIFPDLVPETREARANGKFLASLKQVISATGTGINPLFLSATILYSVSMLEHRQ